MHLQGFCCGVFRLFRKTPQQKPDKCTCILYHLTVALSLEKKKKKKKEKRVGWGAGGGEKGEGGGGGGGANPENSHVLYCHTKLAFFLTSYVLGSCSVHTTCT